MIALLTFAFNSQAQSDYTMMGGANAGIMGPACTNCGLLYGGGITFGYAVTDHIVPTIDLGIYSDKTTIDWGGSTSVYKTSARVVSVSGQFYLKEAYKGFYAAPEISFISIDYKADGNQVIGYPINNITIGADIGWAISIGERIELVPHMGYSTWFENSKGRVTLGTKLGFKF